MDAFFADEEELAGSSQSMLPKCGVCGLYKKCNTPKMAVSGEGRKRVLIVGESPSKTDDEAGVPFAGNSGEHLRDVLHDIDVDMDRDAWFTNAIICKSGSVTPNTDQVNWCRPNLTSTVEKLDPVVVVTLGMSPLQSILHNKWKSEFGIFSRWVGWRIPFADHWIFPTYNPSFLLRQENKTLNRMFSNHLKAAFSKRNKPKDRGDMVKRVQVVQENAEVEEHLAWFDVQGGWVAVDYETNALRPDHERSQIYSCAISNGRRTISYMWNIKTAAMTSRFLKSRNTMKIASNLKMEERWTLKTLKHPVANWGWDTMLASHVLDNRTWITGLKFQSFVKLGMPTYNQHVDRYLKSVEGSPYNRIHKADQNAVLVYGGLDALLEYRLAMLQRKEMGYG
ncbi:MAG: putative uracil DNA glycosylase superfamily protein [Prokaryotic dsDNA virus sp.]|nr:MAG: putative uracil DNA glycosylase superfamily protein [Prokaryotic dsDNA virus sp.]|tara:strand:- start:8544 stop:9725 length:1182 start_codon:yes stop_codon:yes gene_type:complete